jgi:SAM-dependent methyltransferase
MASDAFRALRVAEVEDSIRLLGKLGVKRGDLLEIGAGTGWQAKALTEAGYRVEAIDLPPESGISGHARAREWPITDYDGVHIPFPDNSFDVIYSSNVLEHVVELDLLTKEMKRVLRRGGIALHLLPNRQWRLLSLVSYYPGQALDFARWLRRRKAAVGPAEASNGGPSTSGRSLPGKALHRLLPPTHGAVGTPISEIARFSKHSWDSYFERSGWTIVYYGNNGLIASGDYLLGSLLPLGARRRLGEAVGGIAHVYAVRPRSKS